MLSFNEFIEEMALRDIPRALKLLSYIHKKQVSKSLVPVSKNPEKQELNSTIPYNNTRPGNNIETLYDEKKGVLKLVPIKSIVTGQKRVHKDTLEKKIKGEWTDHDPEHPVVVHHEGTHYVIDGNHQINRNKYLGGTHVLCRVHESDKKERWIDYSSGN
tara:strand:+ start:1261 stop:1737 length:477 start_codon:yes stop_codon:yes gene_type:complete